MADQEQNSDLEEEVWNAIAAFEQILEAMPNDRSSLEALCHAYTQIGDHTRAKDYLIRLSQVLIDEGDKDSCKRLREQLRPYADDDERAQEALQRLSALLDEEAAALSDDMASAQADAVPGAMGGSAAESAEDQVFSLAEELSFAWSLLEADQLSQEDYGSLVQDLTDMSSGDTNDTISVLHALEMRGSKNLDRIMAHTSKACGAPIVALSSFEIPKAAHTLLTLKFMVRRGALVFEFAGNNLLVVIMNPFDKGLRKAVSSATGQRCHFYMTLPSEFDAAIGTIRKSLEQSEL